MKIILPITKVTLLPEIWLLEYVGEKRNHDLMVFNKIESLLWNIRVCHLTKMLDMVAPKSING